MISSKLRTENHSAYTCKPNSDLKSKKVAHPQQNHLGSAGSGTRAALLSKSCPGRTTHALWPTTRASAFSYRATSPSAPTTACTQRRISHRRLRSARLCPQRRLSPSSSRTDRWSTNEWIGFVGTWEAL
jgi:hypothetical protein